MRRTALVAGAVPLVFALGCAALFAAWLNGWRVPGASGRTWFSITKTGVADYTPEPGQPFFFLVVGSDLRPGVAGGRADAIHVIGVNPAAKQATMIDIPRDTEVAIPGHGRNKVNAANALGGPRLTAQAVGNLLGINIPYAIATDFEGFTGMVDEVGGIDVNVMQPMHDSYSGANFNPGVQHMNGQQALAFSRDRHSFPNSDLTRTVDQGTLIINALQKFEAQHTGATGTLEALAILGRHTQLDGMGVSDLYKMSRLALDINPANVRNVMLPVGPGHGSNLSVGAAAGSLLADFRDDAILQSH